MQAVILAAGEGKRVRPLTRSRPKGMIPVANRPIIEYVVRSLHLAGIRDIIVIVGYRKEQVIRLLHDLDPSIRVVTQDKQLGTAHALQCAEPFLSGNFVVLPGDNYIDPVSVAKLAAIENAMLVKEHPSPSNFGVVSLYNGFLREIIEKPEIAPSFTVSTGIFSLTRDVFRYTGSNDIPDVIGCMIREGYKIKALDASDWQDALYPWDLIRMNARLLSSIVPEKNGTVHKSAVIRGPVSIGPGVRIGPYTEITGPVIIGKDSVIGTHCVIQPDTSIGARCTVEPFSIVRRSLVMDDVSVGSHSRVTDAVLGDGCQLSDHTVIRPGRNIVEIDGHFIPADFGAVIGDQAEVSPFCAIMGSIIGNGVTVREESRKPVAWLFPMIPW